MHLSTLAPGASPPPRGGLGPLPAAPLLAPHRGRLHRRVGLAALAAALAAVQARFAPARRRVPGSAAAGRLVPGRRVPGGATPQQSRSPAHLFFPTSHTRMCMCMCMLSLSYLGGATGGARDGAVRRPPRAPLPPLPLPSPDAWEGPSRPPPPPPPLSSHPLLRRRPSFMLAHALVPPRTACVYLLVLLWCGTRVVDGPTPSCLPTCVAVSACFCPTRGCLRAEPRGLALCT